MALDKVSIEDMAVAGRKIFLAEKDDPKLGPLRWLPGTWKNTSGLEGHGFNMISLPFGKSPNGYRLLMNQYDEVLNFIVADVGVPQQRRQSGRWNASRSNRRCLELQSNHYSKIV